MSHDNLLFKTRSVLGNEVVLHKSTYDRHILTGHPEMKGNIDAIKESIEDPDYVLRSKKDDKSLLYYSKSENSTRPKLFVTSVVSEVSTENYILKTSYFTKSVKTQEGGVVYVKEESTDKL